ncbi:MAG TPA: SDR family oxidoreductase [Patescibacteria group bacterium]|nr:SDR family oxidoreductase [Patescibacteria group bacterium]
MAKMLVTGGAGFIGSNLVDDLINKGHQVKVLDNLSTGKKENINPKADFVLADITDLESIKTHFSGIDYVFHVAALPRVQLSIEDPIKTHQININGTLNVLLAARDAKIKKVIYSASSSVLGSNKRLPAREDFLPMPISPYALQKYVGEHYCRLFSLLYDLPTVSLRYFNVYGPRMAFSGAYLTVIAAFLQQKKEGKKLMITGDGTQTRDFTYVSDVVLANILAMENKEIGAGEIFNIGCGDNHSVNEIAKLMKGETENIPPRIEPHDGLADITKAKEILGWQPKVKIEEGIEKTVKWFESI